MSNRSPAYRCLPPTAWPAADGAAWAAAHRRGGLLDDDGLAASWSPATSSIITGGYGRFLAFLWQTAQLDPDQPPAARVTRARVEAFVAALRVLNHSSTVAARIAQLARAVGVMAPEHDWGWLRRIAKRLKRSATPARDDRSRLLPATMLLDLATRLIERGEGAATLAAWRRALLYRDGLMIAVLCAAAPRARNIAETAIGRNLQRRGNGWWIAFGQDEVKNGRPIEVPLPDAFTPWVERHLDHHRPALLARSTRPNANEALWLSHRGLPLTAKEVGWRISSLTKRELGQALNPHLFRKLVPTDLAIHDPAHVGIAQAVLGHATYRTTEQAYNMGRAIDAARRVQDTIRLIRDQGGGRP